jgi:hypothetical protein
MPFWFRRPPEHPHLESLVLRTHDMRQVRALYWTNERCPPAKVGVVIIHPRVDFTHHYAIPRLVDAGFAVLAANTRHANSDLFAEHEEMVLDVAACVRYLLEKRGVDRVVLLGNCGGGSLVAFYQAQARLPADKRLTHSPGGSPTYFGDATMPAAHGVAYVAAHRGQGKVLLDAIDPSLTDEAQPLSVDPGLDMYDARNGFREPPAWSSYDAAFIDRYRAAQVDRVRRLDAAAREILAARAEATRVSELDDFDRRSADERRDVLRRRAADGVMLIHRTMANPAFVDRAIDPSNRDYGSLLSERPDLMNFAALGLARTCTPRAWLSTWSGLSSNADLVQNARGIGEPTLVVQAGRDREVYPQKDFAAIAGAVVATDKQVVTVEGARHYFEPEPGEKTGHIEALMDLVVPWIEERFA